MSRTEGEEGGLTGGERWARVRVCVNMWIGVGVGCLGWD